MSVEVDDERRRRQRERQARTKERLRAEVERGERQVPHGEGGYVTYGCRCRVCTDANTAGMRRRRADPASRA